MAKIPKVLHSKSAQTIVLFFFRQKRQNVTILVCSLFFYTYLGFYRDSNKYLLCFCWDYIRITKKTTHFFGITENKKIKYWDSIGLHRDSKKKVEKLVQGFQNIFMGLYGIIWDYMGLRFFFGHICSSGGRGQVQKDDVFSRQSLSHYCLFRILVRAADMPKKT